MKRLWCILGMLCSLAMFIFGVVMLSKDIGTIRETTTFGADFYMYSHNATVTAANNVKHLCDLIAQALVFCSSVLAWQISASLE